MYFSAAGSCVGRSAVRALESNGWSPTYAGAAHEGQIIMVFFSEHLTKSDGGIEVSRGFGVLRVTLYAVDWGEVMF